ncbi:MAG TPA: ABC transporter permease [Longimicrobiales bacterium]
MAGIPVLSAISGALARLRSLWRGVRRRAQVEAEMREEFRHHIELRTEDLLRTGLSPAEARRRARIEFGSMATHRDAARAARGLRAFDQLRFSWLDVKLGLRMLVKHPGLTIVGCIALAIGIPVALAPLQLVHAINAPLPFDEGERIVGIEYWSGVDEVRPKLHDFERWRRELTSFEQLAAARPRSMNLVGEGGRVQVVRGAEMTASAFAVPRVKPLLGRVLLEADEARGATPVVVIGHALWRTYFGGDPGVVGRTLQLGRTRRTIVGVMPPGFLFPYRAEFWVPLQARAIDYEFGEGPSLWVFGRLRDGVSKKRAQAELTAVGRRIAADHPDERARLRTDLLPYAYAVTGLRANFQRAYPAYLMTLLLLGVACGNVGTLMLARAAARSTEIAVRNALGAGRGRIVMQFFIESLVLACLAAGVGLVLAELVARRFEFFTRSMPFWFDLGVGPFAVAVAGGLAVFSAVIAGLVPALRLTGKKVHHTLHHSGVGVAGLRFGAVATVLIIAETGLAVGCLSGVGMMGPGAFRAPSIGEGIAAAEYLTARLELPVDLPTRGAADSVAAGFSARFAEIQQELSRRLAAEPAVRAVAFASALPGMDHDRVRVEVEGVDAPADAPGGHTVRRAHVGPGFFSALEQPVLMGRGFDSRDLEASARPVIVNRSFVDQVLRGGSPIGRHIRCVHPPDEEPAPWHEIVGVVNDLGMNIVNPARGAGVYHLSAPGESRPVYLLVRLAGDPMAFVPRLRSILTRIDPAMQLDDPARLDEVFSDLRLEARFGSIVFMLVAAIAILLSAAGLYALMAFTVTGRTREIGIRVALGARRSNIAAVVARRALLQLGAGVALGAWLGAVVVRDMINDANLATYWPLALVTVAAVMAIIGLLACAPPTLRALRIQPVQALKQD